MKKILIPVACAAFISTGAMAAPMPNHSPATHTNHSVHTMNHNARPAPRGHTGHHNPAPYVAHVHHAPAPVVVHHSHHDTGAILLGDALIAFAILATNAM